MCTMCDNVFQSTKNKRENSLTPLVALCLSPYYLSFTHTHTHSLSLTHSFSLSLCLSLCLSLSSPSLCMWCPPGVMLVVAGIVIVLRAVQPWNAE